MTHRLYLNDSQLFKTTARIERVGRDDRGLWLAFDQTIFHPQGGGQPSDAGVLRFHEDVVFPLLAATWSTDGSGRIHHYLAEASLSDVADGLEMQLEVSEAQRLQHSSLHTAGHLLAAMGEALVPGSRAVKGHHFPRESYVEFAGSRQDLDLLLKQQDQLLHGMQEKIAGNAAVEVINHADQARVVAIAGLPGMGCGGTHLTSLGSLAGLSITEMRLKSSRLRVSYRLSLKPLGSA